MAKNGATLKFLYILLCCIVVAIGIITYNRLVSFQSQCNIPESTSEDRQYGSNNDKGNSRPYENPIVRRFFEGIFFFFCGFGLSIWGGENLYRNRFACGFVWIIVGCVVGLLLPVLLLLSLYKWSWGWWF